VQKCSQRFDLPESKIRPFQKILMNYEAQLLSGVIFQVIFLLQNYVCIALFMFKNYAL